MAVLSVNIDHVATVREARKTYEPDPVAAAALAEFGGADGITIHLREDRRHIQERDVRLLRQTIAVPMNLELATDDEVIQIACEVLPAQVTLVPEKREEVTTEGGLDIVANRAATETAIGRLRNAGIRIALFLDPEPAQLEMAAELSVDAVELHTGQYALAKDAVQQSELTRLANAGQLVRKLGMTLHAGHGLNYQNVKPVAELESMHELNIGHAIISRAVMVGMERAVRDMKALIN